MTVVTRTEQDVLDAILSIFPDAVISTDDIGDLVIHTYCTYTGKNGEAIIGNMNIDGDEPKWEES